MALQIYTAIAALVALVAYRVYKFVIPTPIPGIPYPPGSVGPFGDVPGMLKSQKETQEAGRYILDKINEMKTPVFQMFVDPIGSPWVIVADSLTNEHILTHRTHEFDLSPLFSDLFRAIVPNSMMLLKTKDPQWKIHRRMMGDTMSARFLNGAAGPHTVKATKDMIELWTEKARLSKGRPFECKQDLADLLMETAWTSAFGESLGNIENQAKFLAACDKLKFGSEDIERPTTFPTAEEPAGYSAIFALAESSGIAVKNPLRSIAHRAALMFDPTLRKALVWKNKYTEERLLDSWKRFSSGGTDIKSAADILVEREVFLANKEQRAPVYDSPVVRDELYTFILGAHDTTATTMQWGIKFLTIHQDVQTRLRAELKDAFGDNKAPDTMQIVNAHLPYVEATVQEILRYGVTAIFLTREAQVDVDILGYKIPKGTQIVMPLAGPGYLQPRYDAVTDVKDPFTGNWDPKELHLFKPSRWLVEVDGETKYDPRAGPNHVFATGTRACFGKRMALHSMRIILTILVLNFELQPMQDDLTDMKCKDALTHHPDRVFVRPVKI